MDTDGVAKEHVQMVYLLDQSLFESSKFKFKELFLICMKYMKGDSFDDIS
jgi:hypothetical protein